MNKFFGHLKTILLHRHYVKKFCFKCFQFRRGLTHDLSKYSPVEFWNSVKYFSGTRSPIDAEKEDKGFSFAWQHHKGHNPHHWEYWIDNVGTKTNTPGRIPYNYVVEMVCDWLGAGIVYSHQKPDYNEPYGEPLKYFIKYLPERIFHPDTQYLLEYFLEIIDKYGINAFCKVARQKKTYVIKQYRRK